MTGFAQGRLEFNNMYLNLMFKSLNHRFLDISFKGTGINPAMEKVIKAIIKDKISRGKIDVVFDLFDSNQRKCNIQFNEELSAEIMDRLLHFKRRFKDKINLSFDSLLKIPMLFHLDFQPNDFNPYEWEEIQKFISGVFDEFLQSRQTEGDSILKDIQACTTRIIHELKELEKETGKLEEALFLKFKEKMTKFLNDFEVEERRILQEAAILAEKSCVNEEINRLSTHTQRLAHLLVDDSLEIKGREADFLTQEMQRETHTIASKTSSMVAHKHVLNIRREIEKIKQQVQNVE